MLKFLKYLNGYRRYIFLSCFFIIIESISDSIIPYITGKFIDYVIVDDLGKIYFVKYIIFLLLGFLCTIISGICGGIFSSIATLGFSKKIRMAIFEKVQTFSLNNIEKFSTASLLTRINADVNRVQETISMMIRQGIRAPIVFIFSTIMSLLINFKISLIFIIMLPILAISEYILFLITNKKFKESLKKIDELNLITQENLISIREIKSFTREKFENNKFNKKSNDLKFKTLEVKNISLLIFPISKIVISFTFIYILLFGGKMAINGEIKLGGLSTIIGYVMQIFSHFIATLDIFMSIIVSKSSRERILEVLNEESNIKDSIIDSNFKDGSIEFKNVSFSYNDDVKNLNLKNINLNINSGETIGIIGSTGSGKTTLINLLLRLYDINSGELLIGGNSINKYKLKTLRENISIVLQENFLFSGTIKENLLLGNEKATDEEITTVCKIAQAHDFIMSFKDGYGTQLGQLGVNLSGGQKQRICIARALLKKSKILILDDATSAIDTITENMIKKNFKEKISNITKIIISQRITSIQNSDKIIVLNNGQINGIGVHKQLLETNKIYKEIYNSQQNEE